MLNILKVENQKLVQLLDHNDTQTYYMKVTIVGFGIAKDILGANEIQLELEETTSVANLKTTLFEQYPAFEKLRSLAIAVNSEYATEDLLLNAKDDIVLIPPVSGG